MDLQAFVAETLRSIAAALDDVNHETVDGQRVERRRFSIPDAGTSSKPIHFDVAVAARMEGGGSGGAGAKITVLGLFSAGGDGKLEVSGSHERVSRIQFSIFPYGSLK